jgi:eukaryotic-like serine/threonine-protein kinase
LMLIPAGTFLMGRYADEQHSSDVEDPQHPVTLSQDFYMGKYEVTKRQWQAVMGTTPWSGLRRDHVLKDLDSPAVYVSWDDAQSFITALNTHSTNTSQGAATFRLPSEAEWEYACRAGTTTRFYWGDDPSYTQINDYAWWDGNAMSEGEAHAHVVGLKLPNTFGLYDMSGNVCEWCEDDYHDSYTGAPTNGSAWVDSPRGSNRLLRGGSWNVLGPSCRSAHRSYYPDYSVYYGGFRVARTP